ncbi:WxL domain-containing protein [Ectobacillus polymachus]|uniref:WxL domain-containing protein n=1 Tax=Ectobacillus polymachus TaxID=1508806 RepID=UPI003A8B4553
MKLPRSISMAAIPVLFLFISSQGILAASSQDSAATVGFYENNPDGDLTLDSVPGLDFGSQKISLSDEAYNSLNLTPFIQVTDNRSINNATGWNVTVKASPFTSTTSTSTLNGATINFSNGDSTSDLTYTKPTTIPFVVTTDGDVGTVKVVSAKQGEGRGTWKTSWLPTTSNPATNDSVTLHVPGGIMANEQYTSTLTWTLSNTP